MKPAKIEIKKTETIELSAIELFNSLRGLIFDELELPHNAVYFEEKNTIEYVKPHWTVEQIEVTPDRIKMIKAFEDIQRQLEFVVMRDMIEVHNKNVKIP